MRNETIRMVRQERLIVILRGIEREKLIPLVEAMYRGGVRLLEITYSADGSTPDTETAERIALLARHFAGRMQIGAGTVLTEEQVVLTHQAGGRFIISPDTCEEIIRKTRELEMVSIPGALTPSEITQAHRAGADFVKLFPVTTLGTAYVKSIRAPLSHIEMLAVGGITEGNLREYLDAGVAGFGIGANIADKKLLAAEDYEGIEQLARSYTSVLHV